jgi:very-short-patch-repair endonuclease
MRNQATAAAHNNARTLRRSMTDSERKLWQRLRMEQLGVKFRRQHPLGNYIADFACLELKLVVELDGTQHVAQQQYDKRRDAFFREHGFQVLRFPTDQPLNNIEGVLTVILDAIETPQPPSQPSPGGGRSE